MGLNGDVLKRPDNGVVDLMSIMITLPILYGNAPLVVVFDEE